ncbi:MAG TPA: YetF domain-containing protein [Candidatus Limnocylindria bacterium]|nr:YetF domain-containing protein [Candidatus Limnocylindria bacterium]
MNTFSELLQTLLGISTEPKELTFLQVSVRGVIVFIATLVMVRLSSKRSLAEKTAFDAVLVVIIGSMLSRAINGSAAFLPTLGSGFVLVLLHRLFGITAYYSHFFGILLKGKPAVLVQNGRLQRKNMLWNHISEHDLQEDMRLEAKTEDLSKIKTARIERSGDISFIKAE